MKPENNYITMSEKFKKLPSWMAVIITAIGMIVLTSVSLGGNSRQTEINTTSIESLKSENRKDHRIIQNDVNRLKAENREDYMILQNDVNQLKVDIGIVKAWVLEQKK